MQKSDLLELANSRHNEDMVSLEAAKESVEELINKTICLSPATKEYLQKMPESDLKALFEAAKKIDWVGFSSSFCKMCCSLQQLSFSRVSIANIASKLTIEPTESTNVDTRIAALFEDLRFFSDKYDNPQKTLRFFEGFITTHAESNEKMQRCLLDLASLRGDLNAIKTLLNLMVGSLKYYLSLKFASTAVILKNNKDKLSAAKVTLDNIIKSIKSSNSDFRSLSSIIMLLKKLTYHKEMIHSVVGIKELPTEKTQELLSKIYEGLAIDIHDFSDIISQYAPILTKSALIGVRGFMEIALSYSNELSKLKFPLKSPDPSGIIKGLEFNGPDCAKITERIHSCIVSQFEAYVKARRDSYELVVRKKATKILSHDFSELLKKNDDELGQLLRSSRYAACDYRQLIADLQNDCSVIENKIKEYDKPENSVPDMDLSLQEIFKKKFIGSEVKISGMFVHKLFIQCYHPYALEQIISVMSGLKEHYSLPVDVVTKAIFVGECGGGKGEKYQVKLFLDGIARLGQFAKGFKEVYSKHTNLYRLLAGWADIRNRMYHARDTKQSSALLSKLFQTKDFIELIGRAEKSLEGIKKFFASHLVIVTTFGDYQNADIDNDLITDFLIVGKEMGRNAVSLQARISKIQKIEGKLVMLNGQLSKSNIDADQRSVLVSTKNMLEKDLGQIMRYLPDEEYLAATDITTNLNDFFVEIDSNDPFYQKYYSLDVAEIRFFGDFCRRRGQLAHGEFLLDSSDTESVRADALSHNKTKLDQVFK
jgi:hypothetical protein